MLQEILGNLADRNEYSVLDYVIDNGIVNRYAKIIFITYRANADAAFEIEQLEKGIVLYI